MGHGQGRGLGCTRPDDQGSEVYVNGLSQKVEMIISSKGLNDFQLQPRREASKCQNGYGTVL